MRVKKIVFTVAVFLTFFLISHNSFLCCADNQPKDTEKEPETEEALPSQQRIDPVLPLENKNIIFVEGEDAVSTDFNKEPIMNYSCSSARTLQLNRITGRQGGAAFCAKYVFYVEEPGMYELWYGGTPPGPEDDMFPSYSSPFSYSIDDAEPRPVYREGMTVVEQYSPSYYWCLVGDLKLEAGQHTVDFTVGEKRRHDGRYYFYLDCFFLVRKVDGRRITDGPLPGVFPQDMGNRSIDFPFRAIEDYQIMIRDEPEKISSYIELALIYSLLSDYLNTLKYLKRAELLDPENIEIQLLMAKNRIWKGDISGGLKTYRGLLLLEPKRLDLWLEAGKVAAWTGRYDESISFYQNGLQQYPENLDLTVNLGLLYLWAGKNEQAEKNFQQAERTAQDDYELLIDLARIYYVNGYPERTVQLLTRSLKSYADRLEIYLFLENVYSSVDKREKAAEIGKMIEDTFQPSAQLSRYLDIFHRKQSLKEQVIAAYEQNLSRQPDNLELRETLAQTYFWNGERKKAINEYLNILANHAFISLNNLDQDSFPLLELIDMTYVCLDFFDKVPEQIKELKNELAAGQSKYNDAQKALQKFLDKVKKAREKGEELPVPEGEDPQDLVKRAGQELAQVFSRAELFTDQVIYYLNLYTKERGLLEEIRGEEREADEVFEKVTRPIRWEWDRKGFIQELESLDSVLARYVLGKVYLLERRLSGAEKLFREADPAEPRPPEYRYGMLQTLIWQGRVEEAYTLIERAEPKLVGIVPYLNKLIAFRLSLEAQEETELYELDLEEEMGNLLSVLDSREKETQKIKKTIQNDMRFMHRALERRMMRSFFYLEENTYLLRNELGDYYLKEEDLNSAIRQFRQVLAIDPWDIDAVYRLGKVYEWNGNWSQALKNYRRVFWTDPMYENITGQYNQLARQNADSLEFSAYSLTDSSRIKFHGEASFTNLLNSLLGWRFAYQTDGTRIYRPVDQEKESPPNYLVHELSIGLPLNFYFWKLNLTPTLGAYFLNDLYGEATDSELAGEVSVFEYLGFNKLEPHFSLEVSFGLGPYVHLNGSYQYGMKEETFVPQRELVSRHSGELNVNTALSFIKAYPFRDSSMRTYGQIEFLSDENFLYTLAQELNIGLFTMQEPYLQLSLLGNFIFQDSAFKQEYKYYTPMEVLVATGGLMFSSWIGIGEESSLNLGFRATGGSFLEKITSDDIRRVQLEVEADLGLSRGEAYYYLRAMFSSTYKYSEGGAPASAWDYWSIYITLGYETKLPRLLTP